MAKKNTVLVKLVATEGPKGFYFLKKKNPKNSTEKLTARKYHPGLMKHVEFVEKKHSS